MDMKIREEYMETDKVRQTIKRNRNLEKYKHLKEGLKNQKN